VLSYQPTIPSEGRAGLIAPIINPAIRACGAALRRVVVMDFLIEELADSTPPFVDSRVGAGGTLAQAPLPGRILPAVEALADRDAPVINPRVGTDGARGVSAAGGQSPESQEQT